MLVLNVGPSDLYRTIAAAMAVAQPGDTIVLAAGYSNETATVTVSGITVTGNANSLGIVLTMATNVTGLTLGGAAPIDIFDSAGSNGTITGNSGANLITVTSGIDVVDGGAGIDRLVIDYRVGGVVTGSSATGAFTAADGRSVTIVGNSIENFTVLSGDPSALMLDGSMTSVAIEYSEFNHRP